MLEKLKAKYSFEEKKIILDKEKDIFVKVKIFSDPKKHNNSTTPIFVMPGGPGCNSDFYYDNVPFLIKSGPVILLDPRGTGGSSKNYPESFHLEQHAEDIEEVRKALKLGKIHFYGTSYGGIVAQSYAVKYQQNIDKLILIVTAHHHSFLEKAISNLKKWGTEEQQKYAMDILNGQVKSNEHFIEIVKALATLYSVKLRKNKGSIKKGADVSFDGFSHHSINNGFGDFLHKIDFTRQLSNIKVDTLVIGGKYDWICDYTYSEEMARLMPNSQLVILPGGHSLFVDCQEAYTSIITNFLRYGIENKNI